MFKLLLAPVVFIFMISTSYAANLQRKVVYADISQYCQSQGGQLALIANNAYGWQCSAAINMHQAAYAHEAGHYKM